MPARRAHRHRLRRRGHPDQKRSRTINYAGVEAVIDKDLTSGVLASDIGAALFVILTAVPQVYVDFGKPDQRALGAVTLDELERLHAEGHFEPGAWAPRSTRSCSSCGPEAGAPSSPTRRASPGHRGPSRDALRRGI